MSNPASGPPMSSTAPVDDRIYRVKKWRKKIEQLASHDLVAALAVADEALEQFPTELGLLLWRASLLLDLGRTDEAVDPLSAGLELDPANLKTRTRLARAHLYRGRRAVAVKLIDAADVESLNARQLEELGRLVMNDLHDYDRAARLFARAAALKGSPDALEDHGLALDRIAADMEQGLSIRGRALLGQAKAALVAGDPEAAQPLFEELVRLCPTHADGWVGLRGAIEARGGGDAAARAAKTGQAWVKTSPMAKPVAAMAMGRKLSRKGLVFDPGEGIPVRGMAEVFRQVSSPEELHATPNAYLVTDPTEEVVTHDPVVSLQPDGSDVIVVKTPLRPTFMAAYENAALAGRGVIITDQMELIADINTVHKPEKYGARLEDGRFFLNPDIHYGGLADVKYYDTPALVMCGPTEDSFGDWINQYPTRLPAAEAAGVADLPVVVSKNQKPHFLNILLALGVRREQLIFQDPRQVSVFPKLYAPQWPWVRTSPVTDLNGVYRRAKVSSREWDGALIYFSRKAIRWRPLANEDEIEALFVSRGFRSVQPEQLDLQSMVDMLASPACVAGAYGSAYHNLVFCKNKPFCYTVMPPFYEERWDEFVRWFGMMDFPLAYVKGDGDHSRTDSSGAWTVPVERVARGLDQVMDLIKSRADTRIAP
jgi:tetratricopeptide (TPR) repeat protein